MACWLHVVEDVSAHAVIIRAAPGQRGLFLAGVLGVREMPEVDGLSKTWLAAFMKMVLRRWSNGRNKPVAGCQVEALGNGKPGIVSGDPRSQGSRIRRLLRPTDAVAC